MTLSSQYVFRSLSLFFFDFLLGNDERRYEQVVVQQQAPPATPGTQRVRITVPAGVYAGQAFQVSFNGRQFRVTCPNHASPGQSILIDIPLTPPAPVPQAYAEQGRNLMQAAYANPPPTTSCNWLRTSAGTCASRCPVRKSRSCPSASRVPSASASRSASPSPPAPAPVPAPAPAPAPQSAAGTVVVVKIPEGIKAGQDFVVELAGRQYTITCPEGVSPGQDIEVEL